MNFIFYFTIWFFISEISFYFSKFTTIGTKPWFGDFIFKIEDFVRYRLKLEKLSTKILGLSYSKIFVCRPCHTFWMSLFANLYFFTWQWSIVLVLLTYVLSKNDVEKQKQRGDSATTLHDD